MSASVAERVFLLPGQFRICDGPEVLETLVGSCVAVCLYNRKSGHAAMNHFLQSHPVLESDSDIGRYGVTSTEHIIQALLRSDPAASHYDAYIFGGAAVLRSASEKANIGQANIDVARDVLNRYRIRIVHEEVGGTRGRRIKFDTGENKVSCRFAGDVRKKNAN
jgi:chemotaxis protein CheD